MTLKPHKVVPKQHNVTTKPHNVTTKPWSISNYCTKNQIFFFQMFWKDRLSKKIALEYHLSCIMYYGIFSRKHDLVLRWKMKDDLSQKVHGDMVFSAYSMNMVFLFSRNMILPFCQKKQRWSSPERIHCKMTSSVSLKKMIFILENMTCLLIGKLKMLKKFTFVKKFE